MTTTLNSPALPGGRQAREYADDAVEALEEAWEHDRREDQAWWVNVAQADALIAIALALTDEMRPDVNIPIGGTDAE